ncbi:hypothetical protein BDZ45DRAFT_606226, partial [Acephala macrosclerotiorum]
IHVSDMVVFLRTLKELFLHLREIFTLFAEMRLHLSLLKSFLRYPFVCFLSHRVDRFGMSTIEERVTAIKNLVFFNTLKSLEIYLGMVGWLRLYVLLYAQMSELL